MKTCNIKIVIFLIFSTLFLGGCATFPRGYQEPVSGPIANVSFLNEGQGFYFPWWPFGKKDQEYLLAWLVRTYDEANGCIGQRVIAAPVTLKYSLGRTAQVKVAAEKEFAFWVAYNIDDDFYSVTYCSRVASFVPENNAFYRVSFGHDKSNADKQCYMSVVKIIGKHEVPVKLKMKKPVDPGFGNSFCEKD